MVRKLVKLFMTLVYEPKFKIIIIAFPGSYTITYFQ